MGYAVVSLIFVLNTVVGAVVALACCSLLTDGCFDTMFRDLLLVLSRTCMLSTNWG